MRSARVCMPLATFDIFSVRPMKRRAVSSSAAMRSSCWARSRPLLAAAVPLGQEVRVVAPVRLEHAVLQGQHRGDGGVEERQVVAHHQQGTRVVGEVPDEPRLGIQVEVVGGLVEQQHIGLGEQDPGQLDPAPLPARHGAHRLRHLVIGDPSDAPNLPSLGLGVVAAPRLELVLEPCVTRSAGRARRRRPPPSWPGLLHPQLHLPDVAGGQDPLQRGGLRVVQFGSAASWDRCPITPERAIVPSLGSRRPTRVRSRVVLPAPF
jgi:hypothetical protein